MPPVVQEFLAWWAMELRGLIPEKIVQAVLGERSMVVLDFRQSPPQIIAPTNDSKKDDQRPASKSQIKRLRRRAAALFRNDLDVVAWVPPLDVIDRSLDLPTAATADVDDFLALEMDQLTPFEISDVNYTYRFGPANRENETVHLDIWITKRELIEDIAAFAKEQGVELSKVQVAHSDGVSDDINLLSHSMRPVGPQRHNKLNAAVFAVACVVVTLGMWWDLSRIDRAVETVNTQLAETRATAASAANIEQQLHALADLKTFVTDKRNEVPMAVQRLDNIANVLPNDSWLSEAHLRPDGTDIIGYSRAPAALMKAIAENPKFSDVKLRSPIVRDERTRIDRFNISLQRANGETDAKPGKQQSSLSGTAESVSATAKGAL